MLHLTMPMKKIPLITIILCISLFNAFSQAKTWKPFNSKVGAFSVIFPNEPKITPTTNQSAEGYTVKGMMHMVQEGNNVAYVIYTEMEAGINVMDDSVYLASSVQNVLARFEREPEFVKDITFEGFPGKHFGVKFPEGLAEGKIILRTNRIYFIAAFFEDSRSADKEKFLNSFHFTPYQERAWKSFTSKDHFFTVDFPAEAPKTDIEETEEGGKLYTYYGLDPQSGNNFSIAVERYSPYAQYKNDSAIFAERTTWRYGENIESQKDVTVSGRPAKELIVKFGNNHFKMRIVTFTNGNLGYMLFAFLPPAELNDKTSNRFFNSFKFSGKVPGNLLADKTDLILKDVASNDTTIWYEAIEAFKQHEFTDKHLAAIEKLVTADYSKDEDGGEARKSAFLAALSEIKSPKSIEFVQKNFSKFKNPVLEKESLSVLAHVNTKESNDLLLELLKQHKPLDVEGWEYYYLFSDYRLDSLQKKQFLLKALPFVNERVYKNGIYALTESLMRQKKLTFTEIQTYRATILNDLKSASETYFKDSTYQLMDDVIAIAAYDQLAKKEIDLLNKLANSHTDYIRIKANAALLRQNQKVNEKSIVKLAQNHYNRVELFTTFKNYDLLKNFPKQYLRQDSLAVSEMVSYVADEYFEPSAVKVLHRETLQFNGKQKLFFVVKFKEPEEGIWYRGVCGPYDPNALSVWEDVTGSDFEPWDENDKDHSTYLKEYLKDYSE